ncbi:MAG: LPS assembly lipoprotein LptE [Dissulfuribacterales bacterium]
MISFIKKQRGKRIILSRIYHTAIIVILCLFVTACGYKFSGGGDLPEGIQSLSFGVLENRTREIGLESQIANDLIYQFTRFSNIELTDKNKADAQLTGIIKSAATRTISHKSANVPTERRIQVVLDMKLTSSDGKVIWSADSISAYETYDVDSDKPQTEQNKKSALATLSSRVAERIYYRLTDNF